MTTSIRFLLRFISISTLFLVFSETCSFAASAVYAGVGLRMAMASRGALERVARRTLKGSSIKNNLNFLDTQLLPQHTCNWPWGVSARNMLHGSVLPAGKLHDKVAVITGAGGGIGKHAAVLFAHEGAAVVTTDFNIAAAVRTADAITDFGGKAVAISGDVSNPDDVKAIIATAEREFGGLHILFNNAGIMDSEDGDAENTSEEVIERTFAVNVKGVMYGCKYGIPLIRKSGGGSIINTASFVAFMGAATPQVAYTASKGAVLALTRELAVIHAREGIRVNSLCPGPLRTDLLMKILDTEEKRQRRLVHIPMGRFGEANEMAKAALFLASNDSSFMTGASLMVDGGITAAYTTPL